MKIRKIANVGAVVAKVIDNLLSTSNTDALSAKQGNVLNNKLNYSTDEIEVGKWTDGKTLYRKTIVTTMTSTNNAWTSVATLNSSEVDMVVNLFATLVGDDGRKIPLPYYENTSYYYSLSYQPPANAIQVYGNGSYSFGGRPLHITIEYTKPV